MVNSYRVEVKPDSRLHGLALQVGVNLVRDTKGQLVVRAVLLIVRALTLCQASAIFRLFICCFAWHEKEIQLMKSEPDAKQSRYKVLL